MARGVTLAMVFSQREERTTELFSCLHRTTDPDEIERLVAELVRVNLPLCDALAARYSGRGAEHDDLVQVARTALLLAIRRYQPRDEGSFAAFAVPTITGELKRYFRDHCWTVRPPRQLQELRARVVRGRGELEQLTGHRVGARELGRHLGVAYRRVEESLAAGGGYRAVSLDGPAHEDSTITLGSSLKDPVNAVEGLLDRLDVRRAVALLAPRERQVLHWRFVEECTQSEIAARLGVSQMQVSRILRRLLTQLRTLLEQPEDLTA